LSLAYAEDAATRFKMREFACRDFIPSDDLTLTIEPVELPDGDQDEPALQYQRPPSTRHIFDLLHVFIYSVS
jgi:hypothetical protein